MPAIPFASCLQNASSSPSNCRTLSARNSSDSAPTSPGSRWHPAEKLHLTLAFLGDDVAPETRRRLRDTLPAVRALPFFLPLAGVGFFGGQRPRALWVGTGGGHPGLFALHRAVHDAVLAAGAKADPKPFVPHVTVAYCGRDTPAASVERWVHANAGFDAGRMRVEGFALFSSVGGVYATEWSVRWPG